MDWLNLSSKPVLEVGLYALITALSTGLGALPFFFVGQLPKSWLGYSNAFAAGLMLAASFRLLDEGVAYSLGSAIGGGMLGLVLIHISQHYLAQDKGLPIEHLQGADALKALMIVGIMTLHSFAEGVGVGVSFGGEGALGVHISAAIAVHNIPEGLAISLILVPRGVSPWKAAGWSVFSSLPQPLLAIPSYLFVESFCPVLPYGLGLAGGAMIWMVGGDLLKDAYSQSKETRVAAILTFAVLAMLMFQYGMK